MLLLVILLLWIPAFAGIQTLLTHQFNLDSVLVTGELVAASLHDTVQSEHDVFLPQRFNLSI